MDMTVNARVRTIVTMDETGQLTGKVTAHMEYAKGREASADVDIAGLNPERLARIKEDLAALQEEASELLSRRILDASVISRQVAIQQQELKG
jgi:hypothetical protein